MESYVLSKKPLLKKTLIASVILIATMGFISYYLAKNDYPGSIGHSIFEASYFLLFISLFLFFATLISIVVISLLEAVGFWNK